MIPIQTLFERVRDLSRKDKAGYMSSDEFNRDLLEAQTLLMDWYYKMFEKHQKGLDSLSPFIKELLLPINNQFVTFPIDYRYKLEMGYVYSKNVKNENCEVQNPELDYKNMQHLKANEVLSTTSSAIRKPKIDVSTGSGKFAYTYVNNQIKVFPKELIGYVYLKYITDPPVATYATTVNTTTSEEDYDAINSVDLIWNEQDLPNLTNLMLLFKGIEVRETALIQWVNQQHNYSNRP